MPAALAVAPPVPIPAPAPGKRIVRFRSNPTRAKIKVDLTRIKSKLDLARKAAELRVARYTIEEIAALLRCSEQHATDLLILANGTHTAVLQAVADKRLAATTAIDFARAIPDTRQQAVLFKRAETRAHKLGNRVVTARSFPIPLGKDRFKPHAEAVRALKDILAADNGAEPPLHPGRRATVRAVLKFLTGAHGPADLEKFLRGGTPKR